MTYIDGSEVACSSVPDREENPLPKDLEVEKGAFLAGLVDLRVLVNVLVVDVLLDGVGEEASPGGPKGVVEGLKPVGEEDLAREAVAQREEDLCEDKDDVLVEVVANDETHSAVAPPSMDQQESVKVKELTEGVVSGSDGLGAFFATDTYSDMRFHNHGDVIGSVTN